MARIEQAIEVNAPVRTVYNQLTQFEEFPRFMKGVHSVHQLDDAHLHWRAEKDGKEMEWDAEIIEQVPDKCIAWRNTSGPKSEGKVSFEPVAPDKTRITLVMEADEAALRHADMKNSKVPKEDHDLARFKKMIESTGAASGAINGAWRGEIHDGQPLPPQPTEPRAAQQAGKTAAQSLHDIGHAAPTPASASASSASASAALHAVPLRAGRRNTDRPLPADESAASGQHQQAPRRGALSAAVPSFLQGWEDPFTLMRKMGEEMDQMFGRWIGRSANPWGQPRAFSGAREWAPAVDIAQQDNQWIVCADLPGIKKEDVQVEITGGKLTIEGERRADTAQVRQPYRRAERNYGHFYRAIELPTGVDAEAAHASMQDGVLEITLPMPPSGHGRRLDIQPTGH